MKKPKQLIMYLCILCLSIAIVGCSNHTVGAQSVTAQMTPTVTPTATVAAVTPTPTSSTNSVQPTPTQASGGDQNSTGGLLQFQGDLFTLMHPQYMGEQDVPAPGQPADNHRFVYPMTPHSWLDVYEHNGDQDPGEMAMHTLSLTNAEMDQAGANDKNFIFTSAIGVHWTGWDTTITLSQPPAGFSSQYHIRILITQSPKTEASPIPNAGVSHPKIVIGILAPESGFDSNYQTVFLPIIQSLVLK